MLALPLTWVKTASLEAIIWLLTCFFYVFVLKSYRKTHKKLCYYEETDFSDEKSSYYQRTLVKFTLLFRETYVVIWQMGRLSCWICFFTEIQYVALFGLAVFYSLVCSLTAELKMDTRLLIEWKNDQENKYNIIF